MTAIEEVFSVFAIAGPGAAGSDVSSKDAQVPEHLDLEVLLAAAQWALRRQKDFLTAWSMAVHAAKQLSQRRAVGQQLSHQPACTPRSSSAISHQLWLRLTCLQAWSKITERRQRARIAACLFSEGCRIPAQRSRALNGWRQAQQLRLRQRLRSSKATVALLQLTVSTWRRNAFITARHRRRVSLQSVRWQQRVLSCWAQAASKVTRLRHKVNWHSRVLTTGLLQDVLRLWSEHTRSAVSQRIRLQTLFEQKQIAAPLRRTLLSWSSWCDVQRSCHLRCHIVLEESRRQAMAEVLQAWRKQRKASASRAQAEAELLAGGGGEGGGGDGNRQVESRASELRLPCLQTGGPGHAPSRTKRSGQVRGGGLGLLSSRRVEESDCVEVLGGEMEESPSSMFAGGRRGFNMHAVPSPARSGRSSRRPSASPSPLAQSLDDSICGSFSAARTDTLRLSWERPLHDRSLIVSSRAHIVEANEQATSIAQLGVITHKDPTVQTSNTQSSATVTGDETKMPSWVEKAVGQSLQVDRGARTASRPRSTYPRSLAATAALETALHDRSVEKLRSALREASALGLDGSELDHARRTLEEEEIRCTSHITFETSSLEMDVHLSQSSFVKDKEADKPPKVNSASSLQGPGSSFQDSVAKGKVLGWPHSLCVAGDALSPEKGIAAIQGIGGEAAEFMLDELKVTIGTETRFEADISQMQQDTAIALASQMAAKHVKSSSAQVALEAAVADRDIAVLSLAISAGESAGLSYGELQVARVVLKEETRALRFTLDVSIAERSIDKLRSTLQRAQEVNLESAKLDEARHVLADEERKVAARKVLEIAASEQNIQLLDAALQEGKAAGLAYGELAEVKSMLLQEERRIPARAQLQAAEIDGDVFALRSAVSAGECAGLDSREMSTVKAALIAKEMLLAAVASLKEAASERSIDKLRRALEEADTIGLGTPAEFLNARLVLADEERKTAAQSALAGALLKNNVDLLEAAVAECDSAGLVEADLDKAKEVLVGERNRNTARVDLEVAVFEKDIDLLRSSLVRGEALGLNLAELQLARGALCEEEKKESARSALEAATAERNIDSLRIAVMVASECSVDVEVVQRAEEALREEEAKLELLTTLKTAMEQHDIDSIRAAIREAMSRDVASGSLEAAHALLDVEERKAEARHAIEAALVKMDMVTLTSAIQLGEKAGLSATELELSMTVLAQEECKAKARSRLTLAIGEKSISALQSALATCAHAGVVGNDVDDARRIVEEEGRKLASQQLLKAAIDVLADEEQHGLDSSQAKSFANSLMHAWQNVAHSIAVATRAIRRRLLMTCMLSIWAHHVQHVRQALARFVSVIGVASLGRPLMQLRINRVRAHISGVRQNTGNPRVVREMWRVWALRWRAGQEHRRLRTLQLSLHVWRDGIAASSLARSIVVMKLAKSYARRSSCRVVHAWSMFVKLGDRHSATQEVEHTVVLEQCHATELHVQGDGLQPELQEPKHDAAAPSAAPTCRPRRRSPSSLEALRGQWQTRYVHKRLNKVDQLAEMGRMLGAQMRRLAQDTFNKWRHALQAHRFICTINVQRIARSLWLFFNAWRQLYRDTAVLVAECLAVRKQSDQLRALDSWETLRVAGHAKRRNLQVACCLSRSARQRRCHLVMVSWRSHAKSRRLHTEMASVACQKMASIRRRRAVHLWQCHCRQRAGVEHMTKCSQWNIKREAFGAWLCLCASLRRHEDVVRITTECVLHRLSCRLMREWSIVARSRHLRRIAGETVTTRWMARRRQLALSTWRRFTLTQLCQRDTIETARKRIADHLQQEACSAWQDFVAVRKRHRKAMLTVTSCRNRRHCRNSWNVWKAACLAERSCRDAAEVIEWHMGRRRKRSAFQALSAFVSRCRHCKNTERVIAVRKLERQQRQALHAWTSACTVQRCCRDTVQSLVRQRVTHLLRRMLDGWICHQRSGRAAEMLAQCIHRRGCLEVMVTWRCFAAAGLCRRSHGPVLARRRALSFASDCIASWRFLLVSHHLQKRLLILILAAWHGLRTRRQHCSSAARLVTAARRLRSLHQLRRIAQVQCIRRGEVALALKVVADRCGKIQVEVLRRWHKCAARMAQAVAQVEELSSCLVMRRKREMMTQFTSSVALHRCERRILDEVTLLVAARDRRQLLSWLKQWCARAKYYVQKRWAREHGHRAVLRHSLSSWQRVHQVYSARSDVVKQQPRCHLLGWVAATQFSRRLRQAQPLARSRTRQFVWLWCQDALWAPAVILAWRQVLRESQHLRCADCFSKLVHVRQLLSILHSWSNLTVVQRVAHRLEAALFRNRQRTTLAAWHRHRSVNLKFVSVHAKLAQSACILLWRRGVVEVVRQREVSRAVLHSWRSVFEDRDRFIQVLHRFHWCCAQSNILAARIMARDLLEVLAAWHSHTVAVVDVRRRYSLGLLQARLRPVKLAFRGLRLWQLWREKSNFVAPLSKSLSAAAHVVLVQVLCQWHIQGALVDRLRRRRLCWIHGTLSAWRSRTLLQRRLATAIFKLSSVACGSAFVALQRRVLAISTAEHATQSLAARMKISTAFKAWKPLPMRSRELRESRADLQWKHSMLRRLTTALYHWRQLSLSSKWQRKLCLRQVLQAWGSLASSRQASPHRLCLARAFALEKLLRKVVRGWLAAFSYNAQKFASISCSLSMSEILPAGRKLDRLSLWAAATSAQRRGRGLHSVYECGHSAKVLGGQTIRGIELSFCTQGVEADKENQPPSPWGVCG